MTIQKTTTDLSTLKINCLTQEMYDEALENDEINENELYLTPDNDTIDSTDIPTASKIAEFDSTAHMNSTDMTSQEIDDFIDSLTLLKFYVSYNGNTYTYNFINGMTWAEFIISDYNKATQNPPDKDFTDSVVVIFVEDTLFTEFSSSGTVTAMSSDVIITNHTYVTSYQS